MIEIGVRKPWPYVLSIKVTVNIFLGGEAVITLFFFFFFSIKKGEWNEETSGGCLNEETFEDNTFYLLTLPKSVPRHAHLPLCIMLEQKSHTNQPEVPGQIIPYPYYIGFYVFNAGRCILQKILCHARSHSPTFTFSSELTEQIPLQVKWKNCHKGMDYYESC